MSNEKLLRLSNGEKYFWQWDTGRRLVVNDDECSQVHYSNEDTELALTCGIYERDGLRVADVPNILLQTAKPLKVHLSVHDGNGMLTTYTEVFQVIPRKKPEDYIYTETEVLSYTSLDKRLQDLEGEGLSNAVAEYLEANPPKAGATTEEAAQIAQNKADIEKLNTDKLDADKLPEAVNDALAQAKASGEFDGKPGEPGQPGEPGYTPVKGVDYFDGQPGQPGEPGQPGADGKTPVKGVDYYTEADKTEMVNAVLSALPMWEGGSY